MFTRVEGVEVGGRYRLVRKLGVGGMGTVWLAQDLLLDSSCALKLIDDDKAESEEVRIRFGREAKVAAQLRGPHVVDVFDHGEWSGIPYIAMEFLDGEDLGTRLERVKVLDPEATYRIVAHVARALEKAHAFGIVHRDLKPENIFSSKATRAKSRRFSTSASPNTTSTRCATRPRKPGRFSVPRST